MEVTWEDHWLEGHLGQFPVLFPAQWCFAACLLSPHGGTLALPATHAICLQKVGCPS